MSTVVHDQIVLDTTGSHNFKIIKKKKMQLKIVQYNKFLEIKASSILREGTRQTID